MSSRRARGRSGRSASGRTLLSLVVLLPALLFGPAVGGMPLWFHSHGPEGQHLHVLPEPSDHDHLGSLHDWHEAQHRHEHGDGTRGEHEESGPAEKGIGETASSGLLIDLPRILAAPRGGPGLAPMPGSHPPAPHPTPRPYLALVEGTHKHEPCHSGWPPQRAERSGIAALLSSSHAILI